MPSTHLISTPVSPHRVDVHIVAPGHSSSLEVSINPKDKRVTLGPAAQAAVGATYSGAPTTVTDPNNPDITYTAHFGEQHVLAYEDAGDRDVHVTADIHGTRIYSGVFARDDYDTRGLNMRNLLEMVYHSLEDNQVVTLVLDPNPDNSGDTPGA